MPVDKIADEVVPSDEFFELVVTGQDIEICRNRRPMNAISK